MSADAPPSSFYFAVVSSKDSPLYELESAAVYQQQQGSGEGVMSPNKTSAAAVAPEHRHLNQFIVHAALDVVDDVQWSSSSAYLKVVDRFNEWLVSAYVMPSNVRLMLLHDFKNEDGVRQFFAECHELYIKILMNPFYTPGTPISHAAFDMKVKAAARRYLH